MIHRLTRTIGFWSQVFIGLLLVGLGTPQLAGDPAVPAGITKVPAVTARAI